MSTNYTVRRIAAELGTSATTVSRALRGDPQVAEETRLEIEAFAKKVGYRVNPAVTALMSQVRSAQPAGYRETLAWINCFDRPDYYVNKELLIAEYGRRLREGAFYRAQELGYDLETFWLQDPVRNGPRLQEILKARGIRGILVPPFPHTDSEITIDWSEFAAVALTYTLVRPELHRIVPDHHYNVQVILQTLQERGYRRIGLIVLDRHDERVGNRLVAPFYYYQQSIAPEERVPVLYWRLPFEEAGAAWLAQHRPDAVVSYGGYRDMRDVDIGDRRYLENLAVVMEGTASYDIGAGFAGMDENPTAIGSVGAEYLIAQLTRNEIGLPSCPQTVLIKGTWINGASASRQSKVAEPSRI